MLPYQLIVPSGSRSRGRALKNEKLIKCLWCGEVQKAKKGIENDFYQSHGKLHSGYDGFIPMCKECLENAYDNLASELAVAVEKTGVDVEKYYVEKRIIERICMINGIYYNDSLFEAALKQGSSHTMCSAYMKIVNLLQSLVGLISRSLQRLVFYQAK